VLILDDEMRWLDDMRRGARPSLCLMSSDTLAIVRRFESTSLRALLGNLWPSLSFSLSSSIFGFSLPSDAVVEWYTVRDAGTQKPRSSLRRFFYYQTVEEKKANQL
jgi:hypothetical protein